MNIMHRVQHGQIKKVDTTISRRLIDENVRESLRDAGVGRDFLKLQKPKA